MNRELAAEKAKYLEQQLQLRKDAVAALVAAGHQVTYKEFRRWFGEEADLPERVASVVRSGAEHGVYEPPETTDWSFRRFPSTWMFMTFQLARLVFTIGRTDDIRRSDLADAHHVAAAPY